MAHALTSYTPPDYPRLFAFWKARGLSARASSIIALTGIASIEHLQRLDRSAFEGHPGVGPKTLDELATLAGWRCTTPVDAIAAALSLSVSDRDECREVATDIAISLRHAGFVISSAPAGRRQLGK